MHSNACLVYSIQIPILHSTKVFSGTGYENKDSELCWGLFTFLPNHRVFTWELYREWSSPLISKLVIMWLLRDCRYPDYDISLSQFLYHVFNLLSTPPCTFNQGKIKTILCEFSYFWVCTIGSTGKGSIDWGICVYIINLHKLVGPNFIWLWSVLFN